MQATRLWPACMHDRALPSPCSLLKAVGGVLDSISTMSGQAAGGWPDTVGTVMLAPRTSGY